jgi:hypothetical protein
MEIKTIDARTAKLMNQAVDKAVKEALSTFGMEVASCNAKYGSNSMSFSIRGNLMVIGEPLTVTQQELHMGLAKPGTEGVEILDSDRRYYPVRITDARRVNYAFKFLDGPNKGKEYIAKFIGFRVSKTEPKENIQLTERV